jgi:hypothetical protein
MNNDRIKLPTPFIIVMILVILLAPLLGGCSTGRLIGEGASFVVNKYCDVPEAGRKAVRKVVAKAVAPNSIVINCITES